MQKFAPACWNAVYSMALVRFVLVPFVLVRRFTALLLLALIASPVVFFGPAERAKAANASPVVISAPPEPFTIYIPTASLAASLAPVSGIFTGVSNTISSIVAPTLPAGLEAARIPTISERAFAFAQPLLAFLVPSAAATHKSAIRNPQSAIPAPPPQP